MPRRKPSKPKMGPTVSERKKELWATMQISREVVDAMTAWKRRRECIMSRLLNMNRHQTPRPSKTAAFAAYYFSIWPEISGADALRRASRVVSSGFDDDEN